MKQRRWFSQEAIALCEVAGEADAVAAMKKLAAELIDDAAFDQPPFDPAILASFRGMRQVRHRLMESAAWLVPERGGLVIEVNQNHPVGKQNLSVNHETCHILVPTYSGHLVDDVETGTFSDKGAEEELLCDIGGAALLLDERWLRSHALNAGPSLAALFHLAELFGASLQATALQLTELGLWPLAFVFWEEDFRKAERLTTTLPLLPGFEGVGRPTPKWRVKHVYVTSTFRHFIPPNKSVSNDSLVAACGAGNQMTSGVENFDLGNGIVRLYCENIHAPYRWGTTIRRRVISLLLPMKQASSLVMCPKNHQMEIL
ncbi:MAG: ImmA/IrrE family metallo-endopeptidase [Chloroflexota bacterium]|nr:ImmA/IrrE family metallo-endopeptidase [Chloroflexota bacterium]